MNSEEGGGLKNRHELRRAFQVIAQKLSAMEGTAPPHKAQDGASARSSEFPIPSVKLVHLYPVVSI